jgi:hypothetical protein
MTDHRVREYDLLQKQLRKALNTYALGRQAGLSVTPMPSEFFDGCMARITFCWNGVDVFIERPLSAGEVDGIPRYELVKYVVEEALTRAALWRV